MREISLFKKCSGPAGFVFSLLLALLLIILPFLSWGWFTLSGRQSKPLGLGGRPLAPGTSGQACLLHQVSQVQQWGPTQAPTLQTDSQAGGHEPAV